MLIGLFGSEGAGKDTVAQILVESLGFTRMSFADQVRLALYRLNPYIKSAERPLQDLVQEFGWELSKRNLPEVRDLMVRMGNDVGRDCWSKNFWLALVADHIYSEWEIDPDKKFVITDVRFENEMEWVVEAEGFNVWVRRPGYKRSSRDVWRGSWADAEIENAGTLIELENKVLLTIDALLSEHG